MTKSITQEKPIMLNSLTIAVGILGLVLLVLGNLYRKRIPVKYNHEGRGK